MTLRSSKDKAGNGSVEGGKADRKRHGSTESTDTVRGPLAGRGTPVAVNTAKNAQ